MGETHARVVVVGSIDTTHHTLVVTKEEDGKSSKAVDAVIKCEQQYDRIPNSMCGKRCSLRNEQAALLKPVYHVQLVDFIHLG